MDTFINLNSNEYIAYQLADIAVQLHKRGFFEPYQHVIKARNALLVTLDNEELSAHRLSTPEKEPCSQIA